MILTRTNIILEGCDKTGKSTIAKLLQQRYPELRLRHFSAPKSHDQAKMEYECTVNVLNQDHGFLFDRFMLGECVYAPRFRGYYPNYMRDLEKRVGPHTVLFLIDCHEEVVKQRFDGQFIKEEDIPDILHSFRSEFRKSNYKHKFMIDTTVISPNDAVDAIVATIERLEPVHTKRYPT